MKNKIDVALPSPKKRKTEVEEEDEKRSIRETEYAAIRPEDEDIPFRCFLRIEADYRTNKDGPKLCKSFFLVLEYESWSHFINSTLNLTRQIEVVKICQRILGTTEVYILLAMLDDKNKVPEEVDTDLYINRYE